MPDRQVLQLATDCFLRALSLALLVLPGFSLVSSCSVRCAVANRLIGMIYLPEV